MAEFSKPLGVGWGRLRQPTRVADPGRDVEEGERTTPGVHVGRQPLDLGTVLRGRQVLPPRLGLRVPTVAAGLEVVLLLERAPLGPQSHPHCRRALQQVGERRRSGLTDGHP